MKDAQAKIAMIMPYFGKWPDWIDLFFYSCGKNQFIDFYVFSDCEAPNCLPSNVKYSRMTWDSYCQLISKSLNLDFSSKHEPYKLCDVRPFYGYIHKDILEPYEFWGYGDFDLCYGDLRTMLSEKALNKYDVFSTHANRASGHFCLLRNNEENRMGAFMFKDWQHRIKDMKVYGFDEYDSTERFIPNIKWAHRLHRYIGRIFGIGHYRFFSAVIPFFTLGKRMHFKEMFTSPAPQDNEEWRYNLETGKLIAPNGKELPYLHFLFFKKTPFYQTEKYWRPGFYQLNRDDLAKGSGEVLFSIKGISLK